MKQLIFYSDTGFPFSILAAAIRVGQLPGDRLPEQTELEKVLRLCGMGKGNASVYRFTNAGSGSNCLALWTGGNGDMVKRAITSFLGLYRIDDYMLVTLKHEKSKLMTAGVWLAKLPMLGDTGLALIHRDVKNIYHELVEIAHPESPH